LENFCLKNAKYGAEKLPFWVKCRGIFEILNIYNFFSVRNLLIFVSILSKICSVCLENLNLLLNLFLPRTPLLFL